jgi:hypothetical protein
MAFEGIQPAIESARCPACQAPALRRSPSRTVFERFRKRLTVKRLHRCGSCKWRGWIVPAGVESHTNAPVVWCAPPQLDEIDKALAPLWRPLSKEARTEAVDGGD